MTHASQAKFLSKVVVPHAGCYANCLQVVVQNLKSFAVMNKLKKVIGGKVTCHLKRANQPAGSIEYHCNAAHGRCNQGVEGGWVFTVTGCSLRC